MINAGAFISLWRDTNEDDGEDAQENDMNELSKTI